MNYQIKGPWEVTFRELTGQYHIKGMHQLDNDEHKMNANLIAAAPEMLETLKEIVEILDNKIAKLGPKDNDLVKPRNMALHAIYRTTGGK
jgi:hypothetical protein